MIKIFLIIIIFLTLMMIKLQLRILEDLSVLVKKIKRDERTLSTMFKHDD